MDDKPSQTLTLWAIQQEYDMNGKQRNGIVSRAGQFKKVLKDTRIRMEQKQVSNTIEQY